METEDRRTIFIDPSGDEFRDAAAARCISQGLRLESDDLIYNAYGIAVAKYLGGDFRGVRFENLILETDWDRAKVLTKG